MTVCHIKHEYKNKRIKSNAIKFKISIQKLNCKVKHF